MLSGVPTTQHVLCTTMFTPPTRVQCHVTPRHDSATPHTKHSRWHPRRPIPSRARFELAGLCQGAHHPHRRSVAYILSVVSPYIARQSDLVQICVQRTTPHPDDQDFRIYVPLRQCCLACPDRRHLPVPDMYYSAYVWGASRTWIVDMGTQRLRLSIICQSKRYGLRSAALGLNFTFVHGYGGNKQDAIRHKRKSMQAISSIAQLVVRTLIPTPVAC